MIQIKYNIYIDESMIQYKGIRSAKPGGQNVNKVSSGIHLKYDLHKHGYPDWFIIKIKKIANRSITETGILNIKAVSHRTQHRNKKEALRRMVELFVKAAKRNKKRIKTKTPLKAHAKRIEDKKIKSQKKLLRKPPKLND